MNNYFVRAERIFSRINQLALISEDENCITRTFGTEAFLKGSNQVFLWMQQAGLQVSIDNIGNVRGKLISKNPKAKTLVIASHMDTVVNAGKFDGPLGVLIGLDLLEHFIGIKTVLPFHIELIAFSDEEGVRFHTTYLGSKVVAGSFDESLLLKKDKDSITLKEAIQNMQANPSLLSQDAILPKDWLGYYEIHIEQGPVLYENNISVAVVSAIAGQKRIEITFTGMAGHAGTVPMDMRSDALCCASEFVLVLEQFAIQNKTNIVATIGKLEIINSASNVIPGKVFCSLDIRSADESELSAAYQHIKLSCENIADKRSIGLDWNLIQETKPVTCDHELSSTLEKAILNTNTTLVKLVSGAGHDAVAIAQVAPVSMLFVRCFEGISHNPLENVELKDVAAAIQVSENFIQELVKKHEN